MLKLLLYGLRFFAVEDYRANWELHTPVFASDGAPMERLRWRIEPVPGKAAAAQQLEQGLRRAAREWEIALSCGTKIEQAPKAGEADVVFRCKNLGEAGVWEENYHLRIEVDGHVRRIDIEADWCETSGHAFYTYVLGRGLGMARSTHHYYAVMAGHALTKWRRTSDNGIGDQERDGLRIASLRRGAPGCGKDDPPWSWEQYPDRYKSHPDAAGLAQMLAKP